VSQNRHAGCEQLDGEADDGLYANLGKLGLDELLLTGGSRELAINLNAAKALGLNEAAAMGSVLI
jgi:hypothetical protein